MNQIISTQQLSNNLGITITKLQQINSRSNSVYYKAITIYGTMCLIMEHYADSIYDQDTIAFLQSRNQIVHKYSQCFPLIYGQHIQKNNCNQIVCISLIQDCLFLNACFQELKNQIRISTIEKLIKSLFLLENQLLSIKGKLCINQLIYCQSRLKVYINFVNIAPLNYINEEKVSEKIIDLVQWIEIHRYNSSEFLKQLILIQDKIYRFDINLIKSAKSIIEIMIMLNICFDLQVEIQVPSLPKIIEGYSFKPTKIKKIKIRQLNGNQKFKYQGHTYESLQFIQGKCINSFIEVQYNQLKQKFIKIDSHYRLRKHQHLFIEIKDNHQYLHLKQALITVHPPVSKIQLINFIIIYMKCIEPIIKSIIYHEQQNSIRIQFINKYNQNKSFKIIFYDKYTVKDEEISMIVERAKLRECKLDVRYMKINDSLVMFLGNSQKTDRIHQLLLSDCHGLTEHGVGILLVSPFCKNLQYLTLHFDDHLLTSALQLLSLKSNLKKLYLKSNHIKQPHSLDSNQQSINLSKIKLTQLSAQGINITITSINPSYLKILKLTQYIHIDQLKHLKNFQLVELKMKIIQPSKKNLIESTSHLITGAMVWKQSGIKCLAEGSLSKTLKVLDLSESNVRFKTIRALLLMPELQQVTLDKCTNLGNEFQPISPKIVKLSLAAVNIQIEHLAIMVQKIPVLVELNVINSTLITKKKIIKFLTDTKKFIKKLYLSQHNYSNRLIQRVFGVASVINYQMVQSVNLYIESLLNIQQEHILFSNLCRACQTQKILNLMTYYRESQSKVSQQQQNKRKRLINQINKFIQMQGRKLEQLKNLSVDSRPFSQISKVYQTVLNTDLNQYLDSSFSLFPCSKIPLPAPSSSPMNTSPPLTFTVFPNQTIDKVLHRFVRLIKKSDQNSGIIFDMNSNRIIDKNIVSALLKYAQNYIISIIFTNCLFKFEQVVDILFQFPYLQQVNNGIYQITLKKSNFMSRTQKYLKFFMKIKEARTFIIDCLEIEDIEILYTVLFHIVDKHSQFLSTLKIRLNTLVINEQSHIFIDKIFHLPSLTQLQLQINEYKIKKSQSHVRNWQQDINNLSQLKILTLKLPTKNYPQLNLKQLQYLNLNFSDQDITEHLTHKIIKNIHYSPLKQLELNLGFKPNIINLNKIFISHATTHLFEKLHSLEKFSIDLEFCNLKEQSLYQTIYALTKCDHLKYIQINASFAISNLKELQNSLHFLRNTLSQQVKISIIAVNGNSHSYSPNQDINSQRGIQFII